MTRSGSSLVLKMINFSEDYHEYGSGELSKMIDEFLKNPYEEGVTYGALSAQEIEQIIALLMYQEQNKIVAFTVGLEEDGYHLSLRIDKKVKQ